VRVAYIVSRFPQVSETFIVRELDAVVACGDIEIELFSLFPAPGDAPVHPAAAPWADRQRRSGLLRACLDLLWWLARRPVRTVTSAVSVVAATVHAPRILVRALVTLLLAAGQARAFVRLGIEHIHAHYATYPTLAAWFSGRLTEIPYSFTAHAHDLFVDQSFLERKVRDAGFVVTVSHFNRGLLWAHGGRGTPVHTVRCGIDPGAYAFRPRRLPASGTIRALCVASLQPYKGHRVLLAALAAGGEHVDRTELDVVGDGRERRALEVLADQLGVSSRVHFLGSLTEAEVAGLLAAADVFVLPSVIDADGQMEGLPVAVVEALASGVPVVATRLSGLPEVLRDDSFGALAEPGDVVSLQATLEDVLAGRVPMDPEAGRRFVETEFDVYRSARRLTKLFEGSARSRPCRSGAL
jgi:colanic acid/amylovoran biosynthesis glycosyltransferase